MSKLYAGSALAIVLAFLGGSYAFIQYQAARNTFADCGAGQTAGGDIGGPFTLIDETGNTVTEADVITKPTLVYFGYTFCPDVCPLDAARNAEAVDILEEQGLDVTPVFITIDPERDTSDVLADFTDNVHPRMLGLTGSLDQIKAASAAYKTYFKKQDTADPYYLMDHTSFTYLMLPDKGFVDFYTREDTAAKIADHAACIISKT